MATIEIKRTSEYVNRYRNYQLFLDGKKIGVIANGKTKTFETTPGPHELVATIDWCSSPAMTFTLKEGETKAIMLGGFKNASWIMPLAMGAIAIHFILQMLFKVDDLIYFVIPAAMVLMYYLTLGRKKYLTISEV